MSVSSNSDTREQASERVRRDEMREQAFSPLPPTRILQRRYVGAH